VPSGASRTYGNMRVQDSRFKIQDSRFKIQDSRFLYLPDVTSTMECLLPIHSCNILLNKQLVIVPSKYSKKYSEKFSSDLSYKHKY